MFFAYCRVPALIVVIPEKVLAPESCIVPKPDLVRLPVLAIGADTIKSAAEEDVASETLKLTVVSKSNEFEPVANILDAAEPPTLNVEFPNRIWPLATDILPPFIVTGPNVEILLAAPETVPLTTRAIAMPVLPLGVQLVAPNVKLAPELT